MILPERCRDYQNPLPKENRLEMNAAPKCLLAVCLFAMAPFCVADDRTGLGFSHEDWQLACDNTRTCRAAGYQSDFDIKPVSVLLTREAGPSKPVTARLKLLPEDETKPSPKSPRLHINGRDSGRLVGYDGESDSFKLSVAQVRALLAALVRDSEILVVGENDGGEWKLSDKGAAAVLLKMDEFQGRLGMPGALIRKGKRDESEVLPPLPMPEVRIPALAAPRAGDAGIAKDPVLRAALLDSLSGDECDRLKKSNDDEEGESSEDEEDAPLGVTRLTEGKLLVSAFCWLAAYNGGSGFWIVNDKPPYQPELVTTDASEFERGQLWASHKGRGLGDCWSVATWGWDGEGFIKTRDANTGLCKGFAGGAWDLPSLVTKVIGPLEK